MPLTSRKTVIIIILNNKVLQIKIGDEVIREIKKDHVTPSEMEKVVIATKVLKDKVGQVLTVSLSEVL